jgi:hypothetical protein
MYGVRTAIDAVLDPNRLPFWFAVVLGTGGVFAMAATALL